MSFKSEPPSSQFNTFKDALVRRIISRPGFSDDSSDSTELDDFAQYLADEVWPTLPATIQEASYSNRDSIPSVDGIPLDSVSPAFIDSLTSCGMCDDMDSALSFLRKILDNYLAEACAPPPVWSRTRTKECEICEREVPLTYHHLIPREVHAKVLKKKWHPEEMLNSVAWLCRCVLSCCPGYCRSNCNTE
jgi:hypothetical protein